MITFFSLRFKPMKNTPAPTVTMHINIDNKHPIVLFIICREDGIVTPNDKTDTNVIGTNTDFENLLISNCIKFRKIINRAMRHIHEIIIATINTTSG